MLSRFASIIRQLLARPAALPNSPRIRRDIGMDDWQGSIGTSLADLLWLPPRA